ncbi:DUF4924 family protein [Cognataquiflexum rubidum]|uniref:DUF4924 family protein n=1 Tax=Cognataquiflexum rubidum TaxID=2922273 RepID=UPI001F136386|nr:DUF4924 family protein [Cognataquiflexum rubidum]MCH6234839.1 DUF4924 family protein [Cognataquiflexum rubidum]
MRAVAEKKKAQNIPEYIIYMYQMEDLLRVYNFSMEDIRQYVISHYPISEAEKSEAAVWFSDMALDMENAKVEESGHLPQTQELVDKLASIHWTLLKTDKDYFDLYQKAKPHFIRLLLEAGENAPKHEIQIALNAIYGQLLARLRSREVPDDILEATDTFGDILSYLNWEYFNQQEGKTRQN